MEGTTTYLVLKLVGTDVTTGASITKSISIPNPVPKEDFNVEHVVDFVENYKRIYGLNTDLTQAYYEVRTRSVVYPEA